MASNKGALVSVEVETMENWSALETVVTWGATSFENTETTSGCETWNQGSVFHKIRE